MKLILLLGILLLNGCALGVFGPEAQARAQERLAEAKARMQLAQEQIRTGFTQLGNSLDQITQTAAQGYGAYWAGRAQPYSYQPPQAEQWHSATVMTPGEPMTLVSGTGQNGTIMTPGEPISTYHLNPDGTGTIMTPGPTHDLYLGTLVPPSRVSLEVLIRF